jgi:hypothetical protein
VLKKAPCRKQRLNNAFKEISLFVFVELGRIKKPQKQAYIIGRMLCMLVNACKDKPISENFYQWSAVQHFINHNINKFTQEVMCIKTKVNDHLEELNGE